MDPKSQSTAQAAQVRPEAMGRESAQVSLEYSMKAFFLNCFSSDQRGWALCPIEPFVRIMRWSVAGRGLSLSLGLHPGALSARGTSRSPCLE